MRIVAKTAPMRQWEVARELRALVKAVLDAAGVAPAGPDTILITAPPEQSAAAQPASTATGPGLAKDEGGTELEAEDTGLGADAGGTELEVGGTVLVEGAGGTALAAGPDGEQPGTP